MRDTSLAIESYLDLPSPEELVAVPPAAPFAFLVGIHPEEAVRLVPVEVGLDERYPTVCAHPEAARANVRHLGPDEMMVKRFDKPDPGRTLTPEELAARALLTYLGPHTTNPAKIIVGPHSNSLGLEYAEVGPITSHRAIALAGMLGMRHVIVADTSFYRAIPNGMSIEYGWLSDAEDTMQAGGVFDQLAAMNNFTIMERYREYCRDQLTFYKMAEINTLTADGERIKEDQWEALLELEQMTVDGTFATLPACVSAELLVPFGISTEYGAVRNVCWGYRNNSRKIKKLGVFKHPVTGEPTARRFCFAQVITPLPLPQQLSLGNDKPDWVWFPELIQQPYV